MEAVQQASEQRLYERALLVVVRVLVEGVLEVGVDLPPLLLEGFVLVCFLE